MSAREPAEIHRLWSKCFDADDIDGILALYEPDAALLVEPGHMVRGTEAIRKALEGLRAMTETLVMDPTRVVQADDVAVLCATWTLTGTAPDGSPVKVTGATSDVARRQPDGAWLMAIDNPWGAGGP